jgi:hypothetical protein
MDKLHPKQLPKQHDPPFIYSFSLGYTLCWTSLLTGETFSHSSLKYKVHLSCYYIELNGGRLLITGGEHYQVNEVVSSVGSFDTFREFAFTQLAPMLTARAGHSAVYHAQLLYVVGGYFKLAYNSQPLGQCERYVCAENRWEALPPLPEACYTASLVVLEGSLYALGGYAGRLLDLIQRLRLEELTWEIMELRLALPSSGLACFKVSDSEVYLVCDRTLHSFTPCGLLPLKAVYLDIQCWDTPSLYRRGAIYYGNMWGAPRRLEIGSLD